MPENTEKPYTLTRSTAIVGPDHPMADKLAEFFRPALCFGSTRYPIVKEEGVTDNKGEESRIPAKSTAIIGPDHPKAGLVVRVFGKALCHGSISLPVQKESNEEEPDEKTDK